MTLRSTLVAGSGGLLISVILATLERRLGVRQVPGVLDAVLAFNFFAFMFFFMFIIISMAPSPNAGRPFPLRIAFAAGAAAVGPAISFALNRIT